MDRSRRKFLVGLGAAAGPLSKIAGSQSQKPANVSLPPLVFIHGIKGSVLRDAHGAVRWITSWQALGLASSDLKLPIRWIGDVQERDGMTSPMPLDSVAWHNVYSPLLKWAAASGRRFRSFSYDWRRDNLETSDEFIRFLSKVSAENGGAKIQVVAHSMGGLITFAAMNRRPDLFHSVLFAGVPFGSSISFLEDLHAGTSNGLNSKILSPEVYFTFPSPFTFFPINPKESGLVDANGKRIEHDWYSAEDWARQKLGIFSTTSPAAVTKEQWTHLRKALERARQLRSALAYSATFPYPPIAVLAGVNLPTISAVMHNGPRAVRGWDFVTAPREPGDKRITLANAVPPAGVPSKLFKSSRAHDELLSDTTQVESILAKLTN